MISINEDRIKKVLPDCQGLIEKNHKRIMKLYAEIDNTDNLIREISYKGVSHDKDGAFVAAASDLGEVMEKHMHMMKQRAREIRAEIWRLTEEIEEINRIWLCYQALREPEASIIHDLYVEKLPYKAAEKQCSFSHRTFEKYRKQGLMTIQNLYNSEQSNLEIITQGKKE